MRQHAFVQPENEHDRELQPFGGVQREQGRRFPFLGDGVLIRDERNFLQEVGERRVLILGGDAAQFHHVLPALLALLGSVVEVIFVARAVEDEVNQLHNGQFVARRVPVIQQAAKVGERRPRLAPEGL